MSTSTQASNIIILVLTNSRAAFRTASDCALAAFENLATKITKSVFLWPQSLTFSPLVPIINSPVQMDSNSLPVLLKVGVSPLSVREVFGFVIHPSKDVFRSLKTQVVFFNVTLSKKGPSVYISHKYDNSATNLLLKHARYNISVTFNHNWELFLD